MAKLHLGLNMCWARKRWPLAKEWAKITREEFGVKYVEYCSDMLDPAYLSAKNVKLLAEEARWETKKNKVIMYDYYTGLATHCLNHMSHPIPEVAKDGYRWCENAIEVAELLGAGGIGGHFDCMPYSMWSDEKKRRRNEKLLIKKFVELSKFAEKHNNKFIMWEQMYTPNEIPYTIDQTREVYDAVNAESAVPVYITVDVGHMCSQNYPHKEEETNPYLWIEKFADISPVIHIQQCDGKTSGHWPFTEEFNKRGMIHPDKIISAIEKSGSKENYLMFEIFHSLGQNEQKVLDDLKQSVDYWRKWVSD